MNIWRRGPLTHNPYVRTAFRVARVPREITRHKTIVSLIGQTRKAVRPEAPVHRIKGELVTPADVNAAEQILLDPKQRILEELLEHATEKPLLERVRRLAQAAAEAMSAESAASETPREELQAWPRHFLQQFIEAAPGPDPSFGALELEIVPPFGRPGEE